MTGAFTSNPALISMLQGKLGSLVGRRSGYIDSLPSSVKRRIHGLQHFQAKHAELEGKFQEEVLALEKKYLELYTPLYNKRAEIVVGDYEPTDEEVRLGEKADEDEEGEEKGKEKETLTTAAKEKKDEIDSDMVGIPEFWLTALKNHPQISETITEQDELVLKHLVNIRMSYMDKPGFKLHFDFVENEHFTDKTLTKTYYYQEHAYGGDYVYDHAEGCDIHWNEGKDLTVKVETKKQRHKGKRNFYIDSISGIYSLFLIYNSHIYITTYIIALGTNKTRVVKRTVAAETFFAFFHPPSFPDDNTELDEEEAEGLDAKLEVDYETGKEERKARGLLFVFYIVCTQKNNNTKRQCIMYYFIGEEFKDKIIPHAIDYFTGKALEYEDFPAEDEFEVNQEWVLLRLNING